MKTLLWGAMLTLCAVVGGCEKDRGGIADSTITAEVERKIDDAEVAGTIEASTSKGIVTLTGEIPHFAAKIEAEDAAQRVEGVARVQNHLRSPAVGTRPDGAEANVPTDSEVR